jgi:hypothetical protein
MFKVKHIRVCDVPLLHMGRGSSSLVMSSLVGRMGTEEENMLAVWSPGFAAADTKSVKEKTRILEPCFHSLDQSPSEAQHVGNNFPLLETPQSKDKFLVGTVGSPTSVPVVRFDGEGHDTSALPSMQSGGAAHQH